MKNHVRQTGTGCPEYMRFVMRDSLKYSILACGLFALLLPAQSCSSESGKEKAEIIEMVEEPTPIPEDVVVKPDVHEIREDVLEPDPFVIVPPKLAKAEFNIVVVPDTTIGETGQLFELSAHVARGTPAGALTWSWKLDGGKSANNMDGAAVSVSFTSAGQRVVVVTATDEEGACAESGVLLSLVAPGEKHLVGDVDGNADLTAEDAQLVELHVSKKTLLPPGAFRRGDVNLDGRLTQIDAQLIADAAANAWASPRHLWPEQGALGARVRVIHPALLAPHAVAMIKFEGSDPVLPVRALPGYATFVVPPDQNSAGAVTLRLVLDGEEVDQFQFEILPPFDASAKPGAGVVTGLQDVGLLLGDMQVLIAAYGVALDLGDSQRATLEGMARVSGESFTANSEAFIEAFQQMEPEGRAGFEQVARANGLDEVLLRAAEVRSDLEVISNAPFPTGTLDPAQAAALTGILCAANELADISDQIGEITAIAAAYLSWFEWWPTEDLPMVGQVIQFLSEVSNQVDVVAAIVSVLADFVPQFGPLAAKADVTGLEPGDTAQLSAGYHLAISTSLCSDQAALAGPTLGDRIEEALTIELAAGIPLAGQAFETANFLRNEMDDVTGLLYDAISGIAGSILDEFGIAVLLEEIAEQVCSMADDETVPLSEDIAPLASCGTITAGTWKCTEECAGTVTITYAGTRCSKPVETSLTIDCLGCGGDNCDGCCDGLNCQPLEAQSDLSCGSGGEACVTCLEHFLCNNGKCSCTSNCNVPGESICADNDVWVCTQVSQDPPCNRLTFSEPCINDAQCVDGKCAQTCGPDTCGGCCTDDGLCKTGDSSKLCGLFGIDCNDCGEPPQGCVGGVCQCIPICDSQAKVCGDDGCGGSCGTCNPAQCDGYLFTPADDCNEGTCVPQASVNCDDDNVCTEDLCDVESGCSNNALDSDCSDGSACTVGDHCQAGLCVAGADAPDCDDLNGCTDDSCDPATGCVNSNNAAPCDDLDACTVDDVCTDGACAAGPESPDCNDDNACTDDSCDQTAGCVNADNSASCDDGNACTVGDICGEGACVPGGDTMNCNDGDPCTDDSCDPVAGCVNAPNTGAPCDDVNACTLGDFCAGGNCVSGSGKPDCNDDNPCTDDSCLPVGGCINIDNTAPCDDGNLCTVADACAAGACVPGASLDCDDMNPCTDDSCDMATGCGHANVAQGPCDDGLNCTLDDYCNQGQCMGGPPLECDSGNECLNDYCDEATGECATSFNQATCDDGIECTVTERCHQGLCGGCPCTPYGKTGTDQQNLAVDYFEDRTEPIWQSFTAGSRGSLIYVSIAADLGDPDHHAPATLRIREGEGLDGAVVVSVTQEQWGSGGEGFGCTFDLMEMDVPVAPGRVYTIDLSYDNSDMHEIAVGHGDPYPLGKLQGFPGADIAFEIVMIGCSQTTDCIDDPAYPTVLTDLSKCMSPDGCTQVSCVPGTGCEYYNPYCDEKMLRCGQHTDNCFLPIQCGTCEEGAECIADGFCSDGVCKFTPLGALEGISVDDMVYDRSIAYVADMSNPDAGLHVISLLKAEEPELVASAPTGPFATGVAITTHEIYVSVLNEGVMVYDKGAPAGPEFMGQYETTSAWDMITFQDGLLLARGMEGVDILTTYEEAKLPEYRNNAGASLGFAQDLADTPDGYVLVAADPRLLIMYADTAEWNLEVMASLVTPGSPQGVASGESRAYVADGTAGLTIVDISNFEELVVLSSTPLPGGAEARSVTAAESYVYVQDDAGEIHAFFIAQGQSPERLAGYNHGGTAGKVVTTQGYAFAGAAAAGFQVLDVSGCHCMPVDECGRLGHECDTYINNCGDEVDCGNCDDVPGSYCDNGVCRPWQMMGIQMIAAEETSGTATAVGIHGNYAYVTDSTADAGLKIYDIKYPAGTAFVTEIDVPAAATRIAVADGMAYLGLGDAGIVVYDLSDPELPVEAGQYDTPGEVMNLTAAPPYLYVADCDEGLRILNVADQGSITEAGFHAGDECIVDVALSDDMAYVVDGAYVVALDVSVPSDPVELGFDSPESMLTCLGVVNNNIVYAGGSNPDLHQFINALPDNFVYGSAQSTNDVVESISINNKAIAYLAEGLAGVEVFDVFMTEHFYPINEFNTAGETHDVVEHYGYAFVADGTEGFIVLDVRGCVAQ